MATIPTLATFVAGEKVTGAKLTAQTKTAIETAVYYKPFCHMQNANGTQNAGASGTGVTYVNLGTIVEDTDSMGNTGSNRIDIKTAGLYRVNFQAIWSSNATGARAMFLWKNAGTVAQIEVPATPGGAVYNNTAIHGQKTLRLAVSDYLQIGGWQTSGVATLTYDNNNGGCYLQAEWISL